MTGNPGENILTAQEETQVKIFSLLRREVRTYKTDLKFTCLEVITFSITLLYFHFVRGDSDKMKSNM